MLITLAPLILGFIAWGFNVCACIMRKKQVLSTLSWLFCACALWFPIFNWDRWAAGEDVAALLDCAHAYSLCATVLLVGNFILTVISFLKNKKTH